MGIIDFLQGYNFTKKFEHKIKPLLHPSKHADEFSATDPTTYANRFVNFLED